MTHKWIPRTLGIAALVTSIVGVGESFVDSGLGWRGPIALVLCLFAGFISLTIIALSFEDAE